MLTMYNMQRTIYYTKSTNWMLNLIMGKRVVCEISNFALESMLVGSVQILYLGKQLSCKSEIWH